MSDKFKVGLSLHACLGEAVHKMGNVVEQIGQRASTIDEDCEDITQARQELDAVVKTNEAIVARVCFNLPLIPNIQTGAGDSTWLKERDFKAEAEVVVEIRLLRAVRARLAARVAHVSLAAHVLVFVRLDCLVTQVAGAAMRNEHGDEARRAIVAHGVDHSSLPLSTILVRSLVVWVWRTV